MTISIRIAGIAAQAHARRQMIDRQAFCILAAYTRTRIDTLVPQARPIRCAIRAQHAFGPAAFVRVAKVIIDALAGADAILLATNSISAARIWHTGIQRLDRIVG